MNCNITNLTGADTTSCLGQGLAPIGTNVTGITGGEQILLGLVILLFLNAFLASKRSSIEIIGVVNFFGIIALVQMGILPNILLIAATLIAAIIVTLAILKWRQQ